MKVERKLSDFFVEKRKRKRIFFGGSGNRNGMMFSGRTDAETEVSVSD
jgi:hypothetical protein